MGVIGFGGVDPDQVPVTSVFQILRNQGEQATVQSISNGWGTLTDTKIYLGDCYPNAFRFLKAQEEHALQRREASPISGALLVHGTLEEREPRGAAGWWFWHGWVELPRDDVVFDGVVQRFYTRASYIAITRAEALMSCKWTTAKRRFSERRFLDLWHFAEGSTLQLALRSHQATDVGLPCKVCKQPWPCPTSDTLREVVRLQGATSGTSLTLKKLLRTGELTGLVPALKQSGREELAERLLEHGAESPPHG